MVCFTQSRSTQTYRQYELSLITISACMLSCLRFNHSHIHLCASVTEVPTRRQYYRVECGLFAWAENLPVLFRNAIAGRTSPQFGSQPILADQLTYPCILLMTFSSQEARDVSPSLPRNVLQKFSLRSTLGALKDEVLYGCGTTLARAICASIR